MRLLARLILIGAALTLAVACGDDGGDGPDPIDAGAASTFSLTLDLNGYGMAHNGDTLYFALWDDADTSAAVATTTLDIVGGGGGGGGGGGNNVEFTDGLEEGKSYTLYWYADVNANMACDMSGDHHWSLAAASVSADAALEHAHTTTFDGDCTKH